MRFERYLHLSFDEMLESWAEAEIKHLSNRLSAETLKRYAENSQTQADERAARYVLFLRRRPVLIPFLAHETKWAEGRLDARVLPEICSYLIDDERRVTIGELARQDKYSLPNFDLAHMRGRPILVAEHSDAPLHVIEGTHRLCELLRLHVSGRLPTVPVILGLCPQLEDVIAKTVRQPEIEGAPV